MSSTATSAIVGFLVAPGVPAFVLYLVNLSRGEAPLLFLILAPLAYAAALFLGLPVYLILQRKRIHSLAAYVILGASIGLVFYVLFIVLSSYPGQIRARFGNSAQSGVLAVVYAGVASTIFWLIAIRPSRNT